jgi:hypothetical protein
MADVFLSYSSKDRAAAERVQQVLERAGISVFWDQETPPGADWDTWIRDKLTGAKAAIVLWSKESIKSPNVRHEAIVARDAGKLVPVMIETLAPSDFPMGLYLVQGVQLQDWRSSSSGGFARLVSEVEARLGRGAGAGHAPPKNPGKIKSVKKPSPVPLVLACLAVAAVLGGVGWMMMKPGQPEGPPVAPETTAAEASTEAPPATADFKHFSTRMVGRWHWGGQTCADGTAITLEEGKLIFASKDAPKFVHAIESDNDKETRTRVLAPDFVLGEQWSLKPEYVGTTPTPAEPRDFQLVVANLTTGKTDRWYPC